jgi:dolichyl-phosphate beta-glucosyltransferase
MESSGQLAWKWYASARTQCRNALLVDGGPDERDARLTVVVPAFNEAVRLAERAARLKRAVESGVLCPRTTELIVVDDGSTDETGWRAEELLSASFQRLRVLRSHENVGKGAAIRLGTSAATAPIVLFMDADLSVDPSEIPQLVGAIGPADVAIGSRSHSDSVVVIDGFQRKIMGRTFNALVTSLTRMPFRDTQCGFKAFRTPLARLLFHLMQVQRFAFDVEILCLARQLGMEIAEVAVQWREIGQSSVKKFADPIAMTRDVLSVWRRRTWPNVPALAVTPAPGERRRSQTRIVGELHQALGYRYPIVTATQEQLLVLLPLSDPIEVQNIATSLRRLPTKLTARERSVSFLQLRELAPFEWLETRNGGLVLASQCDRTNMIISKPAEGWEVIRSPSDSSKGSRIPA